VKEQVGELLDHLTTLARELSPDAIRELSARLAASTGPDAAGAWTAAGQRQRLLFERLVELWRRAPEVSSYGLALALEAAGRTASQVAGLQTIELAWTGPHTGVVPVRRIDQALYEVVTGVERELIVVSYAVFNVPRLVEALNGAAARGAEVLLVLEFEGAEGEQTYDPLVALHGLTERIRVYHWPYAKRPHIGPQGKRGFIHVKTAVADERVALISSANLTAYGLDANMELGLVVRGEAIPQRIARHFRQLVQNGVLEPWPIARGQGT
jgi:phosphatidylserine/phosphatidylglycerophosphate/cardiolipin synthase-like enzyme